MGTQKTMKELRPLWTAVNDHLPTASLDELISANKALVREIKFRQRKENQQALLQFAPNDRVQVREGNGDARLPSGAVGIVKRLGIKNIVVDFGVYRTYRVPAGWLERAPENASFQPRSERSFLPPRRRSATQYEETPPHLA